MALTPDPFGNPTSTEFALKSGNGLLLLTLVYVAVLASVYLTYWALTPDEVWFFGDSFEVPLSEVFGRGAHLGYGQIYWIFLALIDDPLLVRIVAFLSFLTIPAVFWINSTAHSRPLALCAWVVMPLAWWSGKISGPEIFSVSIGLLGVWAICRQKVVLGGMLVGIAIGIKISALPIALFAFFPLLKSRSVKSTLFAIAFVIAGFAVANPFVLLDPAAISSLVKSTNQPENYADHIFRVFQASSVEWDFAQSGGLRQFSAPLPILLLLCYLVFKLQPAAEVGVLTLAAFVLATCMFMLNGRFLGWYWFHVLVLVPFWIGTCKRPPTTAVYAVLALAFVFNVPRITFEVQTKIAHLESLQSWEEKSACIIATLESDGAKRVLDYSEFVTERIQIRDGVVRRFLEIKWDHPDFRRFHATHVVLGSRLVAFAHFSQVNRVLQGATLLQVCDGIFVYRVKGP